MHGLTRRIIVLIVVGYQLEQTLYIHLLTTYGACIYIYIYIYTRVLFFKMYARILTY